MDFTNYFHHDEQKKSAKDLLWLHQDIQFDAQHNMYSNNCRSPLCFPTKNPCCLHPNHVIFIGSGEILECIKFIHCGYLPKLRFADINQNENENENINSSNSLYYANPTYYASWIFLFMRQEFRGLFVEKMMYGIMWDFLFSDFSIKDSIHCLYNIALKHENVPKSVNECYKLTKFNMLVAFFADKYYDEGYAIKHISHTLAGIVKDIKKIFVDSTLQHSEKLKKIQPHIQKWELINSATLQDAYYVELNQKLILNIKHIQDIQTNEQSDKTLIPYTAQMFFLEARKILNLCETQFFKPLCNEIKQSAEILKECSLKALREQSAEIVKECAMRTLFHE